MDSESTSLSALHISAGSEALPCHAACKGVALSRSRSHARGSFIHFDHSRRTNGRSEEKGQPVARTATLLPSPWSEEITRVSHSPPPSVSQHLHRSLIMQMSLLSFYQGAHSDRHKAKLICYALPGRGQDRKFATWEALFSQALYPKRNQIVC